jgi:hypothetical protein
MGSVNDARPLPGAARGPSVGFANLWRMVSPGSGRSMVHYGQATTGSPNTSPHSAKPRLGLPPGSGGFANEP